VLNTIQEHWLRYLESILLVEQHQMAAMSRVLGARSGRQLLTDSEALFIRGEYKQRQWGIYRQITTYLRDEKRVVALKRVALAERQYSHNDISALQVTQQQQEILRGDIALPVEADNRGTHSALFQPHASPIHLAAAILGAIDGGDYVAQNQLVVINRGQQEGLRQGSVFQLYQSMSMLVPGDEATSITPERSKQEKLPPLLIGNLMVVRPYQYFSLAVVTDSVQPVSRHTLLQSPSVTNHDKPF
ncbi:hypothetical protein VII00023_06652, partial [Vibrio ichthyoenteri ATCC 700023]